MAHFAQLNADNIVQQVIVISNGDCGEPFLSYPDTELVGRAYIANQLGLAGEWKQTSYNANFRAKYAGIGDRYDAELDEFVSPATEVAESLPE